MNKLKIIVVDDDPITRMDIKEMLIQAGYEVMGDGKNGEEAIELAHRFRPDIVIMDIKMPKLDGIKAANIIRKFKHTPVILLTAYSQRELINDAKEAGVVGYLVKPVSEEDLIPAIEIARSQQEQFQLLERDIQILKKSIEERKIIEQAKGKIMTRFSCTEEKAYEWMRKKSMEYRISMFKLAEKILEKYETVTNN
ncbi:response regulator NasT [Anoxybacillus tepidamans]|uniref:Response regulator NasT n=1 Tax=Anoxybacteroides tepidamans TaxID=265948 RepID=A0A7W8MUD5_9BACL|nr:response regulator [Anoxybacillus tepidamans]MBB5323081.1 response regulator NasT [Anoxybacillus tepidamans]